MKSLSILPLPPRAVVAVLSLFLFAAGSLSGQTSGRLAPSGDRTEAGFEDYRQGAGELVDGIWRVHLRAQEVRWRPRGERGPTLRAYSFTAGDGAPRVPAPMIRVGAGTPVEVTVTNGLERTLVLRGLNDRALSRDADRPEGFPFPPAFWEESLRLEPGETGTTRFTPTREGSFVYFARTLPLYAPEPDPPLSTFVQIPPEIFGGDGPDGPFVGPLIVDPPGADPAPGEQVMLITRWGDPGVDPTSWTTSWKMMINGRAWPATERLHYAVGDTVRWRVLNASLQSHPMHLHGFFFRLDARGDQSQDTTYAPAERRLAVTERLGGLGESMRVTWVPETSGNWLFHCHLIRHMSALQRIAEQPHSGDHGERGGPAGPAGDHALEGMAGMVMGITVRPRPGHARAEAPVERRLHLYTGRRDGVVGDSAAYGFVLRDGAEPPARDSVLVPGSPLVLTRDEMTEIVVHNRLEFPFGVHWHGLELASRYDGVADWSGAPGRAIPPIAPGDSFAVRMAPPRSGTFIYHVHSEPGHQLAQGMYGAFLVLEPGETFDPHRDRVFVLGAEGTEINSQTPVVNGDSDPAPLEFRAGERYRLRFINISSDDAKGLRLLNGDRPEEWEPVAKDGADLPPSLVRVTPAEVSGIGVGETYDFLWTPDAPGERTLEVRTIFYAASGRSSQVIEIPVRVR